MLIAGFEPAGDGRIFEVSPWGVAKEQPLNYHAIGAGAGLALDSLYSLDNFCESEDLNEIVYRACAAKFAAERAPSVGENTFLFVLSQGGTIFSTIHDLDSEFDSLVELRRIWKLEGQPPIPRAAKSLLDSHLRTVDIADLFSRAEAAKKERESTENSTLPEA